MGPHAAEKRYELAPFHVATRLADIYSNLTATFRAKRIARSGYSGECALGRDFEPANVACGSNQ